MSAVLGHFFDRALPVVEHSEYPLSGRATGRSGLPSLSASLRAAFSKWNITSRKLFEILPAREIENEIAVMFVNQAFQLLLAPTGTVQRWQCCRGA